MKKLFTILSIFILSLAMITGPVSASVLVDVNGARDGSVNRIDFTGPSGSLRVGDKVTVPVVDSTMIAAGATNGGATSMATTTTAVPLGYAYVNAIISSDPAYVAKTLADGKKGQILTFHIYQDQGSETLTITPTTSTGWSVASFDSLDDQATFLYVDDTVGWIVIGVTSVSLTP